MYNILIVEDELLIANLLKNYIQKANCKCAGIAIDFEEAIAILEEQDIDLVLLDVTIFGDKNGIDIARKLNFTYGIPFIFLTSHSDTSTLKLITETKPVGYLSKPFKEIDVVTTLNLYFSNYTPNNDFFKLNIGKSFYNINLKELVYAKSDHVYIQLFFIDKEILIRETLGKLIENLPKNSLVRINRSIAVNPNIINKVNKSSVEIGTNTFKLSASFKHNLETKINP